MMPYLKAPKKCDFLGIIEKKMETTIMDYIGFRDNVKMETTRFFIGLIYWGW